MSNWSNAGRVRPVSKGTWSSTVAYTVLDLVTSSDKLRSYIATQNVPAGTPLTNTAYWQVLVDATAINDTANSLMDRLASPFDKSGSVVTCHPVEGYSLKTKTLVKPAQSGSGDPSPSNIRPISGHTGAKLTRCGKNLLKNMGIPRTEAGISFVINGDGSVTAKGTTTGPLYFGLGNQIENLKNGNTYIVTGITSFSYVRNGTTYYKSDGDTVTIDDAVTDLTPYFWAQGSGVAFDNMYYPMIRLTTDSDATYVPYQGETFSASFGQTVYGGTLDWNTGVLTVDRAIATLTGNESWGASSSNANAYYLSSVDNPGVFPGAANLEDFRERMYHSCSHYKATLYADVMSDNECNAYVGTGQSGTVGASFRFKDARIANVSDWKAYLAAQKAAGTPVQVCYKLATPTTIQLTPAQILALKGTNNLYSDCGDTAVFGRIDPEWMNEQFRNAIIALGGNV